MRLLLHLSSLCILSRWADFERDSSLQSVEQRFDQVRLLSTLLLIHFLTFRKLNSCVLYRIVGWRVIRGLRCCSCRTCSSRRSRTSASAWRTISISSSVCPFNFI